MNDMMFSRTRFAITHLLPGLLRPRVLGAHLWVHALAFVITAPIVDLVLLLLWAIPQAGALVFAYVAAHLIVDTLTTLYPIWW
jgi:hypothetical protein